MSDADGTCEYVLDPDDPGTWGGEEGDPCLVDDELLNEDGVWTCPHGATEAENLCLFHLPVEEKDDDEVVETFLDTVGGVASGDGAVERQLEFVGAKFGAFDLSENSPDLTLEDGRFSMDHAIVTGTLDWSETILNVQRISLNGIRCTTDTRFDRTEFGGETIFRMAEFGGETTFREAVFGGETTFWRAKFREGTTFGGAAFRGNTKFHGTEFSGEAHFGRAEFGCDSYFGGVAFGGDTNFFSAEFGGETDFERVEFGGEAGFFSAKFGGETTFREAEFGGETTFREAAFGDGAPVFSDVGFDADPVFENLTLDAVRFDGADLTDATFTGTSLQNANFESALLSRATLFDADLRGAKLSGAVLGDVRINDGTRFLGHPSDDPDTSPHSISAIRSRPTCIYDPDYQDGNDHADVDKAKSVYRALEELGGKHARPRLQARSFVRRQDLQKDEYKRDAKAGASWEERLIAGARWSRAKVARGTLLYGESPWRVIAWSLGIILSFALLYPLGGWMKPTDGGPITYAQIASNPAEILNTIYYSTLTYTALGFVDFQPVGFGRLLTTLETALGAVMLALLVFILGRRAAR